MIVTLEQRDIEEAISLAEKTLERYRNVPGHYNNRFNSHFKGRLGEIATEHFLKKRGHTVNPLFRDLDQEALCDIAIKSALPVSKIDVKTWTREFWDEMGRCVACNQLPKLRVKADAIVWCVANLPNVKTPAEARKYRTLEVEIVGYSTIEDVGSAPVRFTGPAWGRKVQNHQLDNDSIRQITELDGLA